MRAFWLILVIAFGLALVPVAVAQDDDIETESVQCIDFFLLYDPLELAFEEWDDTDPPDTVKLDAYRVASGYLNGFPFHYEKNRDRITLFQQVDQVASELEFVGYIRETTHYRFDFTCAIPAGTYLSARTGDFYQGHGVSGDESDLVARREAKRLALEEVIRAALTAEFIDNYELIPGVVDGRITWYDIDNEGRDFESGNYVMDVTAWISFEEEELIPANGE